MNNEQQVLINALRDAGYCVVIWTPEELGTADIDLLEDIVIERGNTFIEWSQARPEYL